MAHIIVSISFTRYRRQFTHDPKTYHDPYEFKPARFLGADPELDSYSLAWGFGRRVCPGKDLADAALFAAMTMVLAVFNIRKARDVSGSEVEPVCEYSPGAIRYGE